jgi:hypothetical protein
MNRTLSVVLVLALAGCSSSPPAPGEVADASPGTMADAAVDAAIGDAPDATLDAGPTADAGPADTSTDAAPAGRCTTGVIGPAGGTVADPSGASIVVPVGALGAATKLSLCPQGATGGALGPLLQAGPEGQTFLRLVQVNLPFDATRIPSGSRLDGVQMRMAPSGSSDFTALQSTVDLAAGMVRAATTHFTQFTPSLSATPVFITTSPSLPQATTGASMSQQFVEVGGTAPYTWSVPSGSVLPPGLSLSAGGLLSGTPTLASNFAFFVEVQDSAADSVAMAVSLTVVPPDNPVPSLAQVVASSVPQGSGDTVIDLTGTGFVPTAEALWDGTPLATTFLGSTELAATIPAADLVNAGTHAIAIANPPPGGGTSASVTFTVTPATVNPVPTIASVSPATLPVSSVDVQVSVSGTNFIAASSAVIGSQGIATSYVSSTQILAAVPAAYLSSAGTLPLGVFNPAPGGGFSPTTVSLAVGSLNPVPVLASLSPSSVATGSGAFTLSLVGSGFAAGAQAFFDGTALDTTFASSGMAQAAVPAYLVASDETAQVVLVNPGPGGGASASVAMSVATPGSMDAGSDAGDASDGGNTAAPGTLGGPCNEALGFYDCNQDSMSGLTCSNGICLRQAGTICAASSECASGTTCIPSACSTTVCAYSETSTGVCTIPGIMDVTTQFTCAAGYVCQHDLTGTWQFYDPSCGGVQSPCIPQTIPTGGECDQTGLSSPACAPGLTCTFAEDAGGTLHTCQ